MGIAVVNVLNIDTTGRRTFLHHQREQLNGFHTLLADAVVFLIFGIQAFKLFLIGEECVVQPRTSDGLNRVISSPFSRRVYISLLICTP